LYRNRPIKSPDTGKNEEKFRMKKNLFALLSVLILISFVLSACKTAPTPAPQAEAPAPQAEAPAPAEPGDKPLKIAFFVSDMTNVFHQGQFTEAKKYAKEKYGAEVYAFDGKSDGAVMTQNVDQVIAQGMDAASLHIWYSDAVNRRCRKRMDKGIVMTSFFSPLPGIGIPVARNDEPGVSFEMGAEMATPVESCPPRQTDRDGSAWLAESHRGEVRPYRPVRGGCPLGRSDRHRPGLPGCQQGRRTLPSRSSWTWSPSIPKST
jgi:hypothetical protein